MQAATSPAIHTEGLRKTFGGTVAVDALSMTVPRGEVFGFLGPNGAGKTTVVKLLLGLTRPSGGEALVLGAPRGRPRDPPPDRVPPGLFRYQPLLSAREVLRLHCRLLALPKARWAEEARSALDTVACSRAATTASARSPRGCSSGAGSPWRSSAPRR